MTLIVGAQFSPMPSYDKGFFLGFLGCAFFAIVAMLVIANDGMADRMYGTQAEEATGRLLGRADSVEYVVSSLRFPDFDIDHIALGRCGVVAVETKYHRRQPTESIVNSDVQTASVRARRLRSQLTSLQLDGSLVRGVLVVWTDGEFNMRPSTFEGPYGVVTALSPEYLQDWLRDGAERALEPSTAADIREVLESIAREREAVTVKTNPVLRWLARNRF